MKIQQNTESTLPAYASMHEYRWSCCSERERKHRGWWCCALAHFQKVTLKKNIKSWRVGRRKRKDDLQEPGASIFTVRVMLTPRSSASGNSDGQCLFPNCSCWRIIKKLISKSLTFWSLCTVDFKKFGDFKLKKKCFERKEITLFK